MTNGEPAKRVVISGATGGIGRATARLMAARGWQLLLLGRDEAKLALLAEETGQAGFACDLTSAAHRQALLTQVSAQFGALDALVQCAGVNHFGLHGDQSDEQIEQLVQTNLISPMQVTRLLMPMLERGTNPTIVNTGSVFGHIGFPGFSAYSASKFGLRGFTEALRRECADGPVRVAWLAPRATRTGMNTGLIDRLNADLNVNYDEPEQVAARLVETVENPGRDRVMGAPEKLFARINQLFPGLVDGSLKSKLPIIRQYNQQAMEEKT